MFSHMVLGPKITQMFSEYHEGAKQSEWSPSLAYYQYIFGHYASILGSEMKLLLLINVHVLSVENGPRGPVVVSALEPTHSPHPHLLSIDAHRSRHARCSPYLGNFQDNE